MRFLASILVQHMGPCAFVIPLLPCVCVCVLAWEDLELNIKRLRVMTAMPLSQAEVLNQGMDPEAKAGIHLEDKNVHARQWTDMGRLRESSL